MRVKLLIALTSALLTVLAVLALQERWTGLSAFELLGALRGPHALGFHARFVDSDSKLTCTVGERDHEVWEGGPHEGFDVLDPADLARSSLAWYEEIRRESAHEEHDESSLFLEYRSGDAAVEVRFDADAGRSWEQQLRDWFERFPPAPGGDDAPFVEGGHSWTVRFGARVELRGHYRTPRQRCEVSGWAGTADEALDTMRRLGAQPDLEGVYGPPSFALGRDEQVGPSTMNCYSVDTEHLEELDDLPRRLAAQAEEYRDWPPAAR